VKCASTEAHLLPGKQLAGKRLRDVAQKLLFLVSPPNPVALPRRRIPSQLKRLDVWRRVVVVVCHIVTGPAGIHESGSSSTVSTVDQQSRRSAAKEIIHLSRSRPPPLSLALSRLRRNNACTTSFFVAGFDPGYSHPPRWAASPTFLDLKLPAASCDACHAGRRRCRCRQKLLRRGRDRNRFPVPFGRPAG
jgi:hypothetical protein